VKEHHAVVGIAERLAAGDLGDVQLLVRPHPLFDDGETARVLAQFGTAVRVQRAQLETPVTRRAQNTDDVVDWVNTFRHSDVVVNLSSTATVDASLCDRPVVNLDFDPEPGQARQALVKDVNHRWTHFKPVAESGGVWLVDSPAQMIDAIRGYLAQPELHRAGRRWITQYVCGFTDGRSGERVTNAILEFVAKRGAGERRV
jgi:CDP-glycerol glycerophosphotransferase (TagB/SpsB family)